jgi:hypothetical protein
MPNTIKLHREAPKVENHPDGAKSALMAINVTRDMIMPGAMPNTITTSGIGQGDLIASFPI